MEITGVLNEVLPEQSGTSKKGTEWTKQEFIIETTDKFPKKVCLSISGSQNNISQFNIGQSIKCQVNIESRQWQDKWFTEVKAWKIEANN